MVTIRIFSPSTSVAIWAWKTDPPERLIDPDLRNSLQVARIKSKGPP